MNDLAAIIETTKPEQMRELALGLIRHCRRPDRIGVSACAGLLHATPNSARPEMLRAIWAMQPSRPAWATALMLGWINASENVVAAVRHVGELREWFRHADLLRPPPFLKRLATPRAALPARLRLYRGAATGRPYAASGFSWSLQRGVAALYSVGRAREAGGQPVIFTTKVSRDQVSLVARNVDREVVLFGKADAQIDTADPAKIQRLSLNHARRVQQADKQSTSLKFDVEAAWCGWSGDP
jgi:hypothetical protein